jgi:hypothetical protein
MQVEDYKWLFLDLNSMYVLLSGPWIDSAQPPTVELACRGGTLIQQRRRNYAKDALRWP